MKKKIISLCLVVALAATAVIGGTLAYFTDTDSAKNVMTTGNVSIEQKESERVVADDGSTQLTKFQDNKPLYPAVFYKEDGTVIAPDGTIGSADVPTWGLFGHDEVNGDEDQYSKNLLDQSIVNEVDKIVQVHNNGSRPVYARTIFLMENGVLEDGSKLSQYVVKMWTENGGQNSGAYNKVVDADGNLEIFEVEGTKYSAYIHYYENPVEPGKTTAASLKQIYMDPNATNDVSELIGDEYIILALSQAVQTDGFTDDRAALNAAFGEVTVANCQEWFAELAK